MTGGRSGAKRDVGEKAMATEGIEGEEGEGGAGGQHWARRPRRPQFFLERKQETKRKRREGKGGIRPIITGQSRREEWGEQRGG